MGGREKFATGVDESPFDLRIFKPIERTAADEQDIVTVGHALLLVAKHLAQAAFGAGSLDGVADRGTGGDHAQPGGCVFFF